jgi:hypothetical protein
MEHREDWQGLPKYGGGRARQDSGSAPMLMWAASMAAYNVNMYVGFVCVCVCVYYYRRRSLVGVHLLSL